MCRYEAPIKLRPRVWYRFVLVLFRDILRGIRSVDLDVPESYHSFQSAATNEARDCFFGPLLSNCSCGTNPKPADE